MLVKKLHQAKKRISEKVKIAELLNKQWFSDQNFFSSHVSA